MNGIINVLKPPGMSSNGVTVYLKKLLHEKRIGHAGTLDPGAAGVLIVLLGRSARLSEYLMGHDKIYLAEMHFGCETDTLDSYGKIVQRKPQMQKLTFMQLEHACKKFIGEIEQKPPAYSAIKVDGKKSYELARKGIDLPKPLRKVRIYDIDILEQTGSRQFLLRISCSKGTYIRTLISDIARSMGEIAYTSLLVRKGSGHYDIQDAYTLDEIAMMAQEKDFSFCISPQKVIEELPVVYLDDTQRFAIEHGQKLYADTPLPDGQFALYCGGTFYGIGVTEAGKPKLKIPLF